MFSTKRKAATHLRTGRMGARGCTFNGAIPSCRHWRCAENFVEPLRSSSRRLSAFLTLGVASVVLLSLVSQGTSKGPGDGVELEQNAGPSAAQAELWAFERRLHIEDPDAYTAAANASIKALKKNAALGANLHERAAASEEKYHATENRKDTTVRAPNHRSPLSQSGQSTQDAYFQGQVMKGIYDPNNPLEKHDDDPYGDDALPPSVVNSNVVWKDTAWPGELGAMPLGNGDVAASVWVEETSGDLLFYLSKSDAFDQNSQLLKVGRVRLDLDPPLWLPQNASAEGETGSSFRQSLNIAEAAIHLQTSSGYSVRVWVDSHAPVLRLEVQNKKRLFSARAAMEMWRRARGPSSLARSPCRTYYNVPDTLVPPRPDGGASVTWYHRNDYAAANRGNESWFGHALRQAGLDPALHRMHDPLVNKTFGAVMHAAGLDAQDGDGAIRGEGIREMDLRALVLTQATDDPEEWVTNARAAARKARPSAAAYAAHVEWWRGFWRRSWVSMPMRAREREQWEVEKQYVYSRYLDASSARASMFPIKFNGQAFTADEGRGADYRLWGACYWFQNTRLPYYNALTSGDTDVMASLFPMYLASLPLVEARTRLQFRNVQPQVLGAVWPETMTQLGTFDEGDWGCDTASNGIPFTDSKTGEVRHVGAARNGYVRYHFTGSLELCLLALEEWSMVGGERVLCAHVHPICSRVLAFFRTRFPHRNASTGKTDFYPSQALETEQCHDPTDQTRALCPTNSAPDIAGLRAVLLRLLDLPVGAACIRAHDRKAWRAQLRRLPALPSDGTRILSHAPGAYKMGVNNTENAALYAVHPFRLLGIAKPDLPLAQNTFSSRPFPCNEGWCQDAIHAARLGMTEEAARLVAARAAPNATRSAMRFPGFAGRLQDYEPSVDHFAVMRTAMHAMLWAPYDDAAQRVMLFPAWPVDKWDVEFRLRVPGNTIVEAACVGGWLSKLIVNPVWRAVDIVVLNCRIDNHTRLDGGHVHADARRDPLLVS